MKYRIAVSNGTTVLQVDIVSLGLELQAEVIIPSFTIMSCVQAVIYNNCKPVLVDCEPRIWTIDVAKIEEKVWGLRNLCFRKERRFYHTE